MISVVELKALYTKEFFF